MTEEPQESSPACSAGGVPAGTVPPEGIPETKPARRGCSIIYKNKTLLSTGDPVAQAERAAAEALKPDRTLYFCPSPLLGYGLDLLLSRSGGASAVLCVETDAALLKLSQSSIDEKLLSHPRFALTGVDGGAELCGLVRKKWGVRVFRRVQVVRLSGGWQLNSAGYEGLAASLQKDIALEWGNAMTLVRLGRRFTRNALRNLALLGRSRPLSFGSRPVLVTGAGPSLDTVLEELRRRGLFGEKPRRRFALVCVDTCLSVLRERSIVPDLTVILESQFWNQRDFIGLRDSGFPAALDLSAYPSTAEILGGPVFFFFTPWTTLRIFGRLKAADLLPPVLPPLGSVGLTAVELARRLSSGPVVTAGIDFSFTPDHTHARSSPAHLAMLAAQNRFTGFFNPALIRPGVFATVSKSGIPVKSDPAMRTYRNLFEREFSGDPRVRDIEGSGLSLGLATLTVEEAAGLLAEGPDRESAGPENGPGEPENSGEPAGTVTARLRAFMDGEIALLEELRAILTGKEPARGLETLLDNADYLWAHFPDCAGAEGRRPPGTDIPFLKRVRAEIDPFISLWRRVRGKTEPQA
ncbi:MAG: DUF115 domain-containing protein [Treponema sp.]|jgi:hypothetical protein|nr:DUF115 domain-containing protein [Treponema sp.]